MKQILILTLLVSVALGAAAQTAEEIIRMADERQTFETSQAEVLMRSNDRFGTKESTFMSWGRGSADFLIEFTSAAERGQKVLKVDDELFLFYPDAESIIRMHGAALKQSMFGDVSYEDMTEGSDTLSKYTVSLIGTEEIALEGMDAASLRLEPGEVLKTDAEGHPLRTCWKIEMVARNSRVAYPKQVVWVDQANFVVLKGMYYSKSDRLLKEMQVLELAWFEERNMPVRMVISDKLKRDTSTEMVLTDIEVDLPLDDSMFSLEQLY